MTLQVGTTKDDTQFLRSKSGDSISTSQNRKSLGMQHFTMEELSEGWETTQFLIASIESLSKYLMLKIQYVTFLHSNI